MPTQSHLSATGSLSQEITGFIPREAQQEMAQVVWQSLQQQKSLICEAGTGTGKTFAYLIPALLSEQKVVISTGTKNLQDQLFKRDIPTVQRALNHTGKVALLKGRSNYLCLYHLTLAIGQQFSQPKSVHYLHKVQEWAGKTRSGDIVELTGIPERAEIWTHITATADSCIGSQCDDFDDCFVMKARRKAVKADVLVVNHHLFFADMMLSVQGMDALLPEVDMVIFDEAHQLPQVATLFFDTRFGSRQCQSLCDDCVIAEQEEAGDSTVVFKGTQTVDSALRAVQQALGSKNKRGSWYLIESETDVQKAIKHLKTVLKTFSDTLNSVAMRGKALEQCAQQVNQLCLDLTLITGKPIDKHIQWFEIFSSAFGFHLTPLDIGTLFQQMQDSQQCSWLFTSATLAVGDDFGHFQAQLGLENSECHRWDSPFDFRHSALLYVPQDLPAPRDDDYTEKVVDAAIPVLKASKGRAFFLFTSYRALEYAAERLDELDLPYPLLVQGDSPRGILLDEFRQAGNAILLGTSSFWEGVDVRGDALSCVIIDKLPFAAPNDPILEARIKHLRANGKNPFTDHQLPQAAIQLKQGIGRLIRDVEDKGLLMICDPRLVNQFYGRYFLDSFPKMPKTRFIETVQRFFAQWDD